MDHESAGAPGAVTRPANGNATHSHARPTHQPGGGRTILVIEDEPNISEAIRFILHRDGWTVLTHADGRDALERVESCHPALVILDVMLPGRSGFDILQVMRDHSGLRAVPVLMLTAKGQAADRDMAMRAGASRFMAKPFSNAELLAAVRQLVDA
ncbi:MAG: Response regulators consisting of a CheY-like receiver domain and a winged-helix DNA-binding domain [Rhodobacteraceae bacterium HLUCCA12]|nr:MAG: Response regulators consisting of a CheY-like receiver domain and a winged-helix DNA-binding domain [Rhodobacteraceae bacterium HLUCCA12]